MAVVVKKPKVGDWSIVGTTKRRATIEAMSASIGGGPTGRSSKESVKTILEGSSKGKDLLKAIEVAKRERAKRLIGLKVIRSIQKDLNAARVKNGFSPMVPKKRK
ncbi:MAG: hypothetical protein WCW44_02400 [archaeon]|jgi:hypothetical protein